MIHKTISSRNARRTPAPRLLLRVNFTPPDDPAQSLQEAETPVLCDEREGKSVPQGLREAMIGPSLLVFALSTISHVGRGAKNWIQTTSETENPSLKPLCPLKIEAKSNKFLFALGEAIPLRLTLENCGAATVILEFCGGQSFDFCAWDCENRALVWRWSQNREFARVLRSQILEAGEKWEFEAIWENAPAGRYQISAKLTADGAWTAPNFGIEVG